MSKYLTPTEAENIRKKHHEDTTSPRYCSPRKACNVRDRELMAAAADHALKGLAEKCGAKPCEGCKYGPTCFQWAKAEMAREIVEWLRQPEVGPARHIRQGRRKLTANEIEEYLKEKGITQ